MELGSDINKKDVVGGTPLFWACEKGNKDVVKYLVEHGADINEENRFGVTPLFIACERGH